MGGRSLGLKARKVSTRATNIKIFEIGDILDHFHENICAIKAQFDIAEDLIKAGKTDEAKDIWRSQLVFLDSAFDYFIHEIVQLGILNIYHGDWREKTEKYEHLSFSMADVEEALKNPDDDEWLKLWVQNHYASDALMSFQAFKDVCNLLDLDYRAIADSAFYDRESTEKTVSQLKAAIDSLFFRRNKIAHEADRQKDTAERRDISREDVENFLDNIEKIVNAVKTEIEKKA